MVEHPATMSASQVRSRLRAVLARVDAHPLLLNSLGNAAVTTIAQTPKRGCNLLVSLLEMLGVKLSPSTGVEFTTQSVSMVTSTVTTADGQPVSDTDLLDYVVQIDTALTQTEQHELTDGTIRFQGVTFNWLAAANQGQLVVGGPAVSLPLSPTRRNPPTTSFICPRILPPAERAWARTLSFWTRCRTGLSFKLHSTSS